MKNHCLAKSINDAGWYQFRKWLECFGVKFGRITVAVNPALTSQECSSCGTVVKKSLSVRTHVCQCGFVLDRDGNAAINILNKALSTTKHTKQFWVRLVFETADPAQVESGESQNRQNVSTKC